MASSLVPTFSGAFVPHRPSRNADKLSSPLRLYLHLTTPPGMNYAAALKAADLGDTSSYTYLSVLASAGLSGGGAGGGEDAARTWALCGVEGFETNAALLLG